MQIRARRIVRACLQQRGSPRSRAGPQGNDGERERQGGDACLPPCIPATKLERRKQLPLPAACRIQWRSTNRDRSRGGQLPSAGASRFLGVPHRHRIARPWAAGRSFLAGTAKGTASVGVARQATGVRRYTVLHACIHRRSLSVLGRRAKEELQEATGASTETASMQLQEEVGVACNC